MNPVTLEDYVATLSPIAVATKADPSAAAEIQQAAGAIERLTKVTRDALAALVEDDPESVQALALSVGMSREALKGFLKHRFQTESPRVVASDRAAELVAALDKDYDLVAQLEVQRKRSWTFADVLIARASGRSKAKAGIGRGRLVEDAVEAVADSLGLPHEMRGRFTGRRGDDAPCDLAIPGGGEEAKIVCAAKGFDSSGSKLTDAVGEIKAMAEVRLPGQYVYAVVDGIGWLRRQADLRRIVELRRTNMIDGLYSLAMLGDFKTDLEDAARRLGLLSN